MDDHELQLQIPHFVYNTIPTLVPGGGAEIIPAASASWFHGFTPSFTACASKFPFSTAVDANPRPAVEQEQQQPESSSNPFDYPLPVPQSFPVVQSLPSPPPLNLRALLTAPSALGLPVYSASGFDLLSILARVVTRPFPRIVLGPVDLTCSFVVVDVRRFDHPIVYCSPSFCTLTGYDEHEVLGRNCRFLQAPGGQVNKGDQRKFTSQDAVNHIRKSLTADKECQTSIVNYKKNGAAFINLVTVIPVPGGLNGSPDEHDVVYQVGFQVDLTEQPNAILEKLRDGSYLVNYASHSDLSPFGMPGHGGPRNQTALQPFFGNIRDRKANAIPPIVMSKELKHLLADPAFIRSIPITNTCTTSVNTSASANDEPVPNSQNHPLSMILLEVLPDFIHVVSLKGSFLYVAPSVRRVLGYEAVEMVGTSLANYAHPEDVIPLMRELKESSATGPAATAAINESANSQVVPNIGMPRSVNLLFRAKTKMGRYVWVECRGRLHVEPGKGRKAIILTGRAREMMNLKWEDVHRAGGLARSVRVSLAQAATQEIGKEPGALFRHLDQEVWGMLGGTCKSTATFMSVGKGIQDVLGWTPEDLLGRAVMDIVCDGCAMGVIGGFVASMRAYQRQQRLPPSSRRGPPADSNRVEKVRCNLRCKDGSIADVWFVCYRADADEETQVSVDTKNGAGMSITPAYLVYQIRVASAETIVPNSTTAIPTPQMTLVASASTSSTSSLAGAVSLPLFSGTSVSATPPSTTTTAVPQPAVDMFDELSISRGSSWQYELQQLRITNLRLKEELAALEAAEVKAGAAVGGVVQNAGSQQPQQQQRQTQQPSSTYPPPYDMCLTSYDQPPPPPSQQHRAYNDVQIQPLFTSEPQHSSHLDHFSQSVRYDYDIPESQSPTQHHQHHTQQQQPYLHQPTPLAQYAQPQPLPLRQHSISTTRRESAMIRRPPRRGTPSEWNTGSSVPPMPPPGTTGVASNSNGYAPPSPPFSSSLKRAWSSIDAA